MPDDYAVTWDDDQDEQYIENVSLERAREIAAQLRALDGYTNIAVLDREGNELP